ncbi:MAG: 4-oxalomesaconate tautomerase [Gammaproteobacteria bacterium]|jgi:2-methylaconitate cis-trans-isomerase PrpF
MTAEVEIPCMLMRGGTSKGPYFLATDLPADREIRDRMLLAAMGSPDARQIDGLGGATTLTSKVAIVSTSTLPDADIGYQFAQVSIDQAIVDTTPTCGNMLAGVGPFAIERGLVAAADGETTVHIHDVNTGARIVAVIQTPGGKPGYEGATEIDGVPGAAAPVRLRFQNIQGAKTGKTLPTGRPVDSIDGVEVTCIDVAMPMVIMRAADLGKTGYESKAELDADGALLRRLEAIRLEAACRMGMGDVSGSVIPKLGLVAPPARGGSITSRYFVPHQCHAAHAVSGGICVATCALMRGTVADGIGEVRRSGVELLRIEHPSGRLEIELGVQGYGPDLVVDYGGVIRTARKIMDGAVFLPAGLLQRQ